MELTQAVRQQAIHPFRELPMPVGWRREQGEYVTACLPSLPIARIIEPRDFGPAQVGAAVEEARTIVRADGEHPVLIWWVAPEHRWLDEHLVRFGLANSDTPGFESVENAMVLTHAPGGEVPPEIHVGQVENFEDFAASERVGAEVFGTADDERGGMEAELPRRYEEYRAPGNPLRHFVARIEDRVVGTAMAVAGAAGLNLFGGSVLSEARGRGVYRALINARWNLAVESGTPCLTVQAGRMSRPIVEHAGFEFLAAVRIYVDDLVGARST